MKKLALHWQVIIALILGLLYSYFAVYTNSESFPINAFTKNYISPFGEIFIKLLKMIAVPLVLFSIISGIVNLKDVKKLGRIGTKTLLIYVGTTMLAVTIGLGVVNMWKPGERVNQETRLKKRIEYELWLKQNPQVVRLDDICESCKPENQPMVNEILSDTTGSVIDDDVRARMEAAAASKAKGPLYPIVDAVPNNIFDAMVRSKMLQIIFFAIFFGIVLIQLPRSSTEPVIQFIESANLIFVRMVEIVMFAMPYFVFALMAGTLIKIAGDNINALSDLFNFLLQYSFVVVVGLAIMAFVIYPILVRSFGNKMTFRKFFKGINKAQLTAFSTSSSVATLPVTMECVNDNLEVPESTSSFVLPIGATVNMDGTSLYQAVAVVAMAQFHMVDLSVSQQLVIVATATLASIGAAAVPSAGLVLMILVLESVGLNPAWIAIIIPVDRILDMCRTVVNVTGDASVSVIVSNDRQTE
ncbi:MAG: dicarboxylate/amino acid:cation symporter [Bacteroidia bacterium]|nr:dicarboxylate/amino acid:cation symporter [Bacteroidia bacterium]